MAVDAPGIRRFLAANEDAKKKNLMVAVGLQRRHDPRYIEAIKRHSRRRHRRHPRHPRLLERRRPVGSIPREPQQTEMEYQMRNWYYFTWLCGDHIVEQHIHNIDVSNWIKDMLPGQGQRHGPVLAERLYRDPDPDEVARGFGEAVSGSPAGSRSASPAGGDREAGQQQPLVLLPEGADPPDQQAEEGRRAKRVAPEGDQRLHRRPHCQSHRHGKGCR